MKTKIVILLAVFGSVLLAGCTKDQITLNRLKGYWTLQYQNRGGVIDTQLAGCTWYFRKCRDSKNIVCQSVVNCYDPSFSYNLEYQITDKGRKLLMEDSGIEWEILKLDDHEFVVRNSNSQFGFVMEHYAR